MPWNVAFQRGPTRKVFIQSFQEGHYESMLPLHSGHKQKVYISQETVWSGVKETRREDCDVPDRAVGKCRRPQGKYT